MTGIARVNAADCGMDHDDRGTVAILAAEYRRVRANSEALCDPLETEDYGLQAMAETSPPKWHLAHTSWFFETFVLRSFHAGHRPSPAIYEHIFNSYYNGIGTPFSRPERGLLSRPTVAEVYRYRADVDEQVLTLLDAIERGLAAGGEALVRIELGLHHEQQHQELLLTDLKYSFSVNPLQPAYHPVPVMPGGSQGEAGWQEFQGGIVTIGAGEGFSFDNETPRHRQYLEDYALARRAVTNGEYLAFMEDGGYRRPELWLADGWDLIQREQRGAPLYWRRADDGWCHFTLAGEIPLVPSAPACHLNYYEADAYARWAGARLPTEAEWEHAAAGQAVAGNFVDTGYLHPQTAANTGEPLAQLFGDIWEWTTSSYGPYPGYSPAEGAIGEYNGKFMSNQMVLRGGSCVSDAAHIRASYRNFFYPGDRWQFTGLRLARTL